METCSYVCVKVTRELTGLEPLPADSLSVADDGQTRTSYEIDEYPPPPGRAADRKDCSVQSNRSQRERASTLRIGRWIDPQD